MNEACRALCSSLWSAPGCPERLKYQILTLLLFYSQTQPRGYAPSLHPRSSRWLGCLAGCLLFCWRSFYGPTLCLTLRGILLFCPLYKRNARCLNFISADSLSYSYLFIRRWQDLKTERFSEKRTSSYCTRGIKEMEGSTWRSFLCSLDLTSSLESVCCRLPHPTGIFLGFPLRCVSLSSDTHSTSSRASSGIGATVDPHYSWALFSNLPTQQCQYWQHFLQSSVNMSRMVVSKC